MVWQKLRKRQHDNLSRMLQIGSQLDEEGGEALDEYKVLVLDKYALDLLAPLMRTDELRKHGVTLHMLLSSPRERVPDVPAVYLVRATQENADAICDDLSKGLYDSIYINFTGSSDSSLLQTIASAAASASTRSKPPPSTVEAVYDRNAEFVSLEHSLFTLEHPHCYSTLNDPTARDASVEHEVSCVSQQLQYVCLTLGTVPIIRCPRGGPAEMVAAQLSSLLHSNLGLLPPASATSTSSRPVLCLFDRNFELAPAVQHAWTYQALAKDLLGMRLNKVNFTVESKVSSQKENSTPGSKSYELDMEHDPFWREYARAEFHDAAESVDAELKRYKQDAESVTNMATSSSTSTPSPQQHHRPNEQTNQSGHQRTPSAERTNGVGTPNGTADSGASTNGSNRAQSLASAVNSLPKLQERKAVIDKHTNMATAMLGEIKSRGLDAFNRTEEGLLEGRSDKSAVQELLDGSKGTARDKLRLALVYVLSCEHPPSAQQLEPLERSLQAAGANTAALTYVRKLRSLDATLKASKHNKVQDSSSSSLASQSSNLFDWADRLYGQGMSAVTRGVSSLLQSGGRQPAITRSVELLMENKANTEAGQFARFDPRSSNTSGVAHVQQANQDHHQHQHNQQFKDALVFIIGGGCYMEHHSLQEMARKSSPSSPKRIIYGCTALLSGDDFVDELAELGSKS